MQNTVKYLSIIFGLIILISCSQDGLKFSGKKVSPPVATRQLGPSIFFSENILTKFNLEEGKPIRVYNSGKYLDLRPYLFFGKDDEFGIHNENAEILNIKEGINNLTIKKINQTETELTSKPVKFYVENNYGNLSNWKGYAFGAPHGDCDNETGSVLKILTKKYGIPSTSAYGCRLSYRGIWFDCNRPLMKEPKENKHGTYPERKWNEAAIEKYKVFQDSVLSNSKLKIGERFKLFCSFHGHDLTVKLPNGEKIQRPVIEGMGMGFSDDELRKIKRFYNSVKNNFYENPPDLYFGNLPEDSVYYYEGIKLNFFYSGLGSRTYGTLRRNFLENGLHFETPNLMRIPIENQKLTADLLAEIYMFVRDSIFTQREIIKENEIRIKPPKDFKRKMKISQGKSIMGVGNGKGWSSERPQHTVFENTFFIDKYEVTNLEFANFLNSMLNEKKISIKNGVVELQTDYKILYKTKEANPFSEILFDGKFKVKVNRDYFPVVFVTYWGAEEYAKYVGGRLPTEAEWEKAASWNPSKKEKSFYSIGKNTIEKNEANYERTDDPFEFNVPGTTPIGFYKTSSSYGVKDMSGNVWEWTSDYYVYSIYSERQNTVTINPKATQENTMKSIRGGAWDTEYSVLRSSMRLGINPNEGLINLGFRCVYEEDVK